VVVAAGLGRWWVITGTTSGLGRATVRSLLQDYTQDNLLVICANRDVAKAQAVHEADGLDSKAFKCVELNLASFTRQVSSKVAVQ